MCLQSLSLTLRFGDVPRLPMNLTFTEAMREEIRRGLINTFGKTSLSSEKSLASELLASKIRSMKHPLSIFCFILIPVVNVLAQESSKSSTASALPPIPPPMSVPAAGPTNDAPYAPQPIVQGGVVIPLYPPDSPHLKRERIREPEVYNMSKAVPGRINSITNIHNPSIEVHTVEGGINTGAAIILAAGGGHRTLNVGSESADFVPFFYNYGVNTIILRNRLRNDGYNVQADAVNDALQAIRLVRAHAKQWNIDPNKIGIMGFSAGAELASAAAIEFEDFDKKNGGPNPLDSNDPLAGISSRPDFIGLVYPGPSPFSMVATRTGQVATRMGQQDPPVPRKCPPAFIVCGGSGDRVHAIWADVYMNAMLQAGVPNVEMHIYGNGRHPGEQMSDGSRMTAGLTAKNGIPFGTWQDRFIDWFRDLGFLQKPGVETKAAKDVADYSNRPQPNPLFVPGNFERRSATEKK